jgi:hypothetical protein
MVHPHHRAGPVQPNRIWRAENIRSTSSCLPDPNALAMYPVASMRRNVSGGDACCDNGCVFLWLCKEDAQFQRMFLALWVLSVTLASSKLLSYR